MLIETFIAEAAVERFDECVLCGLSRFDEVQINAGIARPADHLLGCEFWSVVGDDAYFAEIE